MQDILTYRYKPTTDEINLMKKEFIYFLKHDLKLNPVDITKIKMNKKINNRCDAFAPSRTLYYDTGRKKISTNPNVQHYKNNECNIFEFYRNSEILIKFKDISRNKNEEGDK